MMIIILEGCGTRAERVALSGSGSGGDGTRGAPQTGPLHGSPPRSHPRPALPCPAAGTPGTPLPSAGGMSAVSGAKGGASPGSVRANSFPPPQLSRLCQGKCGVNFKGSDSPCRAPLAPTSLVPLKPKMPLGSGHDHRVTFWGHGGCFARFKR